MIAPSEPRFGRSRVDFERTGVLVPLPFPWGVGTTIAVTRNFRSFHALKNVRAEATSFFERLWQ